MKPTPVCLAVAAVAFAVALADEPAAVKHRFLAVDNGGNQLLCVDQIDPARFGAVAIPAGSRDIQILTARLPHAGLGAGGGGGGQENPGQPRKRGGGI